MDSSVETNVRGGWKGECGYQLWLYWCMRFAHTLIEIANEDFAVQASGIQTWISSLFILDCAVEVGRLVEEIWTRDLFIFRASLCVACEIVLRAVRALCYVLLHVLCHYNIQIVGGFQLYAFPITYCVICVLDYVLMCACNCFYFRILMINCRRGYVLCMKLK